MVDIYRFDEELNAEILKELENSFKEGRIDEKTYLELKERYEKKLKDAQRRIETTNFPIASKVSGSQKLTEDTIKFSGSAHLEGGKIDKNIRISGSGKINGDIECNDFQCSGSLKSSGNMILNGNLKSSGSFSSDGGIKSNGNVKFSSSTNIGKSLFAKGSVKSSGSFKCNGYLKTGIDIKMSGSSLIGDFIESNGFLHCSGSLSCGNDIIALKGIKLSGGSDIGGNIRSNETIDITGRVEVEKNIEANNIEINCKNGVFQRRVFNRKKSIVGGSIIGSNRVEVDNVDVKGDIYGYDVAIGPQSLINGKINYVNSIQIDKKAKISNEPTKIGESELEKKLNSIVGEPEKKSDIEMNSEQRYCPICGEKIDEGGEFCPNCGTSLE
ncbi:MAG: zinc ribbon domain-containing protein [Promethearchaeota archaeon]